MRPETESELAAMLRAASGPVSITGGASRLYPGEGQGTRIDMRGMAGITLYEPAALTLVVRAGTPLAEVQAVLAAENQMLGFEPDLRPGSTIGGVAASNSSSVVLPSATRRLPAKRRGRMPSFSACERSASMSGLSCTKDLNCSLMLKSS